MQVILSKEEIKRLKKKWIKNYTDYIKNLPDSELNDSINNDKHFEFTFSVTKDTTF